MTASIKQTLLCLAAVAVFAAAGLAQYGADQQLTAQRAAAPSAPATLVASR